MKISFRTKITLFVSVAILATIVASWILNRAFLETYYVRSRKSLIRQIYNEINKEITVIDKDGLSEEQQAVLDRYQLTDNVNIYLFNDFSQSTVFGTMYLTSFVYPKTEVFSNHDRFEHLGMDAMKGGNRELMRIYESYANYLFNGVGGVIRDIEELENSEKNGYRIMTQYDTTVESEFMDIYGTLDCGYICFVRVGLESISKTTSIVNKFLFMVGALMVVLAIGASSLFARHFTRPVSELSEIAKRMSKLDFNVKYKVDSNDEIGALGTSMNSLSETLESTISELKQANIKLQSDIARKEEIDAMRTEFLSNVTHELKTPIAIIQGYAEGLKDCVNDDEESRNFYCDVIADEACKMNNMVKNLLSLTKLESGGVPISVEHFNLKDAVSYVVNSADILAKKSDATISVNSPDNCMIWADEYMVEEVITNYLSNAIHHADGEKRVEINITKDNAIARLSVFNTGAPIPENELDKIWSKFYKVDKARTREYGGTGIGLSIVKAIMEAHHMNYGVQNREAGVEFWAEFDCAEK